MKVNEMAEKCGWTLLSGKDGINNEIDGCYVGDLLSWVMGRAQEGNLWFTVMGNVNAIAVATLAETSAIVLTESSVLDADAKMRSEAQGIPVYSTAENTYQAVIKAYELLK